MNTIETPLFERVRGLAEAFPDKPAATCSSASITRSELVTQAEYLARNLKSRGVIRGDLVAIVLPNDLNHIVATCAIWALGAVPQPLSPKLPERELTEILRLSRPRVVIGLDPALFPTGIEIVSIDVDSVPSTSADPLPPQVPPAWKAPTSGGSTGRPKIILAGTPGVWESIEAFADILNLPGEDGTSLITAPMSHNAPFMAATLSLLRGAHVVVMPRFDAEELLAQVERHHVTWIYAVPTMMGRVRHLPSNVRERFDVSSIQVLMHMAAPCPRELKHWFITWLGAKKVWELYAGTEAQALTTIRGDSWLTHPGSVGTAVAGQIQVRDDSGSVVESGQVGRIWMRRTPGTPPTYEYIGASATVDEQGWETLGDVGWTDVDGYLYLGDRETDMILVGGANVYPAEIESALMEHPAILDACVVGRPHDEMGEVPHAFVQLRSYVEPVELRSHMQRILASYKVPRSFTISEHPFRDDAGKVRRSVLKAQLVANLNEESHV
ncbi:AMP-binding protein [Rhodococcus sp. IEGM1428]|uniref:AMP-binding protein n=1 Tax=Rhodococcus sp. IEGM1428 TaxID=3392191 RepID=UPI003D145B31